MDDGVNGAVDTGLSESEPAAAEPCKLEAEHVTGPEIINDSADERITDWANDLNKPVQREDPAIKR